MRKLITILLILCLLPAAALAQDDHLAGEQLLYNPDFSETADVLDLPVGWTAQAYAEGGAALNNAKKVLAYTLTAQVHGEEEADRARQAAEALFGGGGDLSNIPTIALTPADIEATGLKVTDLLVMGKLSKSKSDARRLIEAGSVLIGDEKVTDVYATVNEGDLSEGVVIKKGKKGFVRVVKA